MSSYSPAVWKKWSYANQFVIYGRPNLYNMNDGLIAPGLGMLMSGVEQVSRLVSRSPEQFICETPRESRFVFGHYICPAFLRSIQPHTAIQIITQPPTPLLPSTIAS